MASKREIEAMRLAIALSAYGLGTTSPNPPVGCVILDAGGQVVGTGYHRRKGEPHAEAHALAAAGDHAAGATAVVTLEPCNHVGRTPACRQLLLDAGIARVLIAVIDPTSRGEGGAAVLRANGVDVEVGVLADEARLVLGLWIAALTVGRPAVLGAYMATDEPLDTSALGDLRASVDAVLFPDGHVEEGVPGSHEHAVLELPTAQLSGSPDEVLKALYAGGVRHLLLAGGRQLVQEYANAGTVDRVVVYLPETHESRSWSLGPAELVPSGFGIERVVKTRRHIRIDTVPVQGN